MALVRLKNVCQAILFVDSLNLVLRPNEVRLFDEEKAKNDSQLMQCILLGKVLVARMDGDFVSYAEVKEVKAPPLQAPIEAPAKIVAPQNADVASAEVTLEVKRASSQNNRYQEDLEPKNTTPVVMFGNTPQRRASSVNSEIAMPDYINPDDLIGPHSENDPENGDVNHGDIIYADAQDKIEVGSEGIVDARNK